MKFRFAFEKLLDHKRRLEDLARRDWLEARAKVDAAMKRLDGLYQQVEDARIRSGTLESAGGKQAVALSQIDFFINGQKIRIENQRVELRELMGEAERLHEILIEAAKEKKTLDKLKERRQEEFKLKRKKMELKEADELVVTRYKRTENGF